MAANHAGTGRRSRATHREVNIEKVDAGLGAGGLFHRPPMPVRAAFDLVAEARARIENLNVKQVAAELERGDVLLVDLREQNERETHGVIPGAFHAPRGMLEFWSDPSLDIYRPEFRSDRRIILHCAVGGRSALAADTLRSMGYRNVAHLEGGFEAWKAAGYPVAPASESPEAPVERTNRTA